MKILIATTNTGKLREIKALFENFAQEKNILLLSLKEMPEIPFTVEENGKTFEENALIKARAYANFFQMPVLADDSGLCVEALNGEPGVYSARYAGEKANDLANNQKLLKNLENIENRKAYFECAAVFYQNEFMYFCGKGRIEGKILTQMRGNNGFGYDPLFEIPSCGKTLAELSLEEKNQFSHRKKAFESVLQYLKEHFHELL